MSSDSAERREDTDASATSSARRDPLVGTVVNGKFEILSLIAQGGMSRVYRASQLPLERPVALKVVRTHPDDDTDSQFSRRFLQEASILAKLPHPNIVTLYDYGKIEGATPEQYFIAMEYLDGGTLAARLAAQGPLPPVQALAMARQVVLALRDAHAHGIVHRDLKPSNILMAIDTDGNDLVKVVDFGIGKMMNKSLDGRDITVDGAFVGTPKYMAPEQFEGIAYPSSDLHALGTVLFEALTGKLPFDTSTMTELLIAKSRPSVVQVQDAAPNVEVSPRLESLVNRLLAVNTEERPTMNELLVELAGCEDELGVSKTSWPAARTLQSSVGSSPTPFSDAERTTERSLRPVAGLTRAGGVGAEKDAAAQETSGTNVDLDGKTSLFSGPRRTFAIVAGVALLLVLGLWIERRRAAYDASSPVVVAHGPTSLASSGSPSNSPGEPTATNFTLAIDSTPTGADVFEGATHLGTTPLQITIERASVEASPRTFSISKDGFVTARVVQGGDAVENIRSIVTLAPVEADPIKSPPPSGSAALVPTKTATEPPAASTKKPTDIRLQR